jgi:voltage-gated potassium channel
MMKDFSPYRLRLVRQGLLYSLALVFGIFVLGGLGFWLMDPKVHSFSDGLWLSFTTAATVGYGDMVPSNGWARLFAVLVVLLGLAVLSLVTASLAAIFVERQVEADDRHIEADLLRELRVLRAELHALRADVVAGLSSAHVRSEPPDTRSPAPVAPESPGDPGRP